MQFGTIAVGVILASVKCFWRLENSFVLFFLMAMKGILKIAGGGERQSQYFSSVVLSNHLGKENNKKKTQNNSIAIRKIGGKKYARP